MRSRWNVHAHDSLRRPIEDVSVLASFCSSQALSAPTPGATSPRSTPSLHVMHLPSTAPAPTLIPPFHASSVSLLRFSASQLLRCSRHRPASLSQMFSDFVFHDSLSSRIIHVQRQRPHRCYFSVSPGQGQDPWVPRLSASHYQISVLARLPRR